jgi:hypothetical protein
MRFLAWMYALVHMAASGEFADCKPVWAHDPKITGAFVPEEVWYGVPAVYCEGDTYTYICTNNGCAP